MKYLRIIIAILIIPLAGVFTVNFFNLVLSLSTTVSVTTLPFWIGLGSYFIFQVIFFKPIKTYVLGHELTHAIVGLLSGARLQGFKVSSSGGHVKLSKINVWITLAPYFVPIYTTVIVFAYWIAGSFWPVEQYYSYFLFAVGFSLSFHFSLTYFALAQGQSDMKQFGIFFSTVFILIVNCIVMAGLFKILFPEQVDLKAYLYTSAKQSIMFWQLIVERIKAQVVK